MSDATVAEITEQKSVWSYLVGIIDKPHSTFTGLLVNPRLKWVLPLVLALLVAVVSVWVAVPHSSEIARQATIQQLNESGMSPEQMDEALAQTARFQSPLFLGIVGSVAGVAGLVIIWLVVAGLFYFLSLVAGAEFNYGAAFVVVAWASLPVTLRSLVQTVLIAVTGKFPIYTGLAALQVSGDVLKDSANPMIGLLSFADIFWIWHLVLLVVGLAVATKFSRVKAAMIVLLYAVLSVGLTVGLTMLGAVFRGG
ncbi:MAG: YIP1 family protein [Anaerolineae bacterium]